MKFLYKLTGLGLMIALLFTFGFATPTLNVSAGGYLMPAMGGSITIGKYVAEYDYDDVPANNRIRLPNVTHTGGALATEITDSGKREVQVETTTDDGGYTYFDLPAGRIGSFTVNYSVTAGIVVAQKSIVIKINGINPKFNFDTNSEKIMPIKTIPGIPITLPNPEVLDNDDEVIPATVVSIEVKDPMHQLVSTSVADGYHTFTPVDGTTGIYYVTYTYNTPGAATIRQTFAITVVSASSFTPTGTNSNISLGLKTATTVPTTASLGVETVFPKATGFNSKENDAPVNVYAEITIKNMTDTTDPVVVVKDYKHTFKKAGSYLVTYKIKDFFGNTAEHSFFIQNVTDNILPTIKIVADYTALATDPTVDGDGVLLIDTKDMDDFEDVSYLIPSVVGTSTDGSSNAVGPTITVPAAYVKDNVDNYAYLKTRVVREVVKKAGSTVVTLDGSAEAYEAVTHTFAAGDVGEWIIRYKAFDSTSSSPTTLEILVTVKDGTYKDSRAPEVSMNGVPSVKKHGDKFKVLKPTVADYVDATQTEVADSRVQVKTEYLFNDEESTIQVAKEDEKDKAYFAFEVPSEVEVNDGVNPPANETVESMTIRTTATDDAGNVTVLNKKITIIDTSSDVLAPLLVDAVTGDQMALSTLETAVKALHTPSKLVQNAYIELPVVSFRDQGVNFKDNVSPIVTVTDADGALVSVTAIDTKLATKITRDVYYDHDGDGGVTTPDVYVGRITTLQNYQFFASGAGNYTITYSVTDVAGNSYTFAYVFGVENKTPPAINVDNLKNSAEWGDLIDLKDVIVSSGGVPQDYDMLFAVPDMDANGNAEDSIDGGATLWPTSTILVSVTNDKVVPEFSFNSLVAKKGTYTLRFWAKDADGNITTTYVERIINAKDSLGPTFTVEGGAPDGQHSYDASAADPTDNDITIPGFDSIEDTGSGVDYASAKIVVQYSDASIPLATFTVSDTTRVVRATKNGTLNITYSVSDKEGNPTSKSYQMSVGDIVQPTIEIAHTARNLPGNKKIGYTLSIQQTDLKLMDAGIDLGYARISINVKFNGVEQSKDTDSEGTILNYTFKSTGTVTVTFAGSDDAGNAAQPVVHTFTITSDTGDTVVPTVVWGTILLVVSILALGGVIFYFVKPAKGDKSGKGKASRKK